MPKLLHTASICSLLGLGGALVACGPENDIVSVRGGVPGEGKPALQSDDPCAPQNLTSAADHPFAMCAMHTDSLTPDLARIHPASTSGGSGGVQPQDTGSELGFLDAAGNAAGPLQPSCQGKAGPGLDTCGVDGKQSCCAVTAIPDGKADGFAVDAFSLDQFEVTSGRFEQFVLATGGDLRSAATNGKWPGWDPAWNEHLPASRAEVDDELGASCKFRSAIDDHGALTWPWQAMQDKVAFYMNDDNDRAADIRADATPARLHEKPINCVSYWVAAAYCAWDGGRLPTNAEWSYAAYGGKELRTYPWGNDAIQKKHAVYDLQAPTFANGNEFTFPEDFEIYDNGMNAYHIAPPGRKPAGRARFGNDDMAGNLVEWTADLAGNTGTVRGGSWEGHPLESGAVFGGYPLDRTYGSLGMRCAYGAAPEPVAAANEVGEVTPVLRGLGGDQRFEHGFELQAGYASQGVAFEVAKVADAKTRELHACVIGPDHFVSNDPLCEGQTHLGALGYVYEEQRKGTLPLYRCYGAKPGRHLSTVTPDECAALDMQVEGTQGFVVPPAPGAYVRHVYSTVLLREPENAGYQAWMGGFRANGCSTKSLADFGVAALTSPEFLAFGLDDSAKIARAYQSILERAPDAAGLQSSLDALAAGTTWAALVQAIANSDEAAALAPKRCEQAGAGNAGNGAPPPNQDGCGAEDGWFCSVVNQGAAYRCAAGAHTGGAFCEGAKKCVTEAGHAKMNGEALACE